MADIEAGNLAPPKAKPVGKPDDRCIARRLLRTPVICRNGKDGLHAPEARPFRVPVRPALHAFRFQAKRGDPMPPGACHKRVQGRHGAIDRSRGKPARDFLRAPRVGDGVRLAVFESEEMRDRFGNIVPARESGEGLDFLPIGAARVLRCKT